jgi:peptide/nickel transport system ATP-binding protein
VQRLLVMYGGTVVESGATADVFAQPAHPYTHGLIAARPRLGSRLAAGPAGRRGLRLSTIPGRVPDLADLPPGCAFADRCALVIEACRQAPPAAVPVGTDHAARCLRTDAR